MAWDWSTAGKLKNGEPFEEKDKNGNDTYMTIKGSFIWKKNVVPEYVWFNGTADHYLLGDKIKDTTKVVKINSLFGSANDPHSKIIPVKIHRGKQIYDKNYMTMIQPKLFSPQKGDSAFWKDYDWNKAAAAGMKYVGLPYSGEYGFVETEMYWPVNHMVAPKEMSLNCSDCHTRENSRLAGLKGFYMPGRDHSLWDRFGKAIILVSIIGVAIHGAGRILTRKK